MKLIARTMAENGGVAPGLVTDDFEFTVEAHPSSRPATGRPGRRPCYVPIPGGVG